MLADENLKVMRTQPTLRELALVKIRDAILSCRFKPGHRLIERELCEQLGVSRSIVREVLRHLEAEGIVETIPLKGPIVARPRLEQAMQIYEIRAMLEGHAARSCAEHAPPEVARALEKALREIVVAHTEKDPIAAISATTEFYRLMFLGGQKEVAWQVVRSLNARINLLRAMTISSADRAKEGTAELKLILDAIKKGDGAAAEAASVVHVRRASAIAQELLASFTTELDGGRDRPGSRGER